jgi:hypothetical protein
MPPFCPDKHNLVLRQGIGSLLVKLAIFADGIAVLLCQRQFPVSDEKVVGGILAGDGSGVGVW